MGDKHAHAGAAVLGKLTCTLKAFSNCTDVFIIWRYKDQIQNCEGFALKRKFTAGKKAGQEESVNNRIDFSKSEASPLTNVSSVDSPFRRFSWTDHGLEIGDKVQYQVTPMVGNGNQLTALTPSDWSDEVEITPAAGTNFSCYFNRGLLISQFMSAYMKQHNLTAAKVKAGLQQPNGPEAQIRAFLGGPIRQQLLDLLKPMPEIYAALYELSDLELMASLEKMKKEAHVLLTNGSHGTSHGKTITDENATQRAELKKVGVDVHDRIITSKGLGHNKFMVVCDGGKPASVWSGSTNWTPTGLCTQINNGILIDDPKIAQIYSDQWDLLVQSKNGFPKDLIDSNDQPKKTTVAGSDVTVWFAPTSDFQEMDAVVELIRGAQQGILFLMFEPGKSVFVDAIVAQQVKNKNLYVHGVISTMNKEDMNSAKVSLVHRGNYDVPDLDIVQPDGIPDAVDHWAKEITHGQFLKQIGWAIVHSKVIVIDPLGKNPILVTGSHNFSASASSKNDENLIIIEGNQALAQAYAVNIKSVYDHYRFRAYAVEQQKDGKDPGTVMDNAFDWQAPYFQGGEKQVELDFWLG